MTIEGTSDQSLFMERFLPYVLHARLLVLVVFLGFSSAARATQPLQQVLFDFEGEAQTWMPNVWGGPGTVVIEPSQAPKFGAGALRSTLKGVARGGNTISPWLPEAAPWRELEWGVVSLWFKGDGSPTKASLKIQTGEGSKVEQDYTFDLPMDSTEWRRFLLPAASFWNRGRVPMDLQRMVRCYVGHRGDHAFEVDQISLEAAHRSVPLFPVREVAGADMVPELFQFRDGRHGVRFDPSRLLPGPATVRVEFQFPGAVQVATETLSGDKAQGESYLLAEPAAGGGPSTLRIEVIRQGKAVPAAWSFEAAANRPLPDPTRLSLLPAPKECRLGEAVFPLASGMTVEAAGAGSRMAARMLAEDLGETWPDVTVVDLPSPEGSPLLVRMGAGCDASAGAMERLPQLPAGGYLLDAGPRGATVRARDSEGARNGVLTLSQAVESHWAATGDHAIPELHVVDWPNLPIRAVSIPLPNGRWGHPNDAPVDPDFFLRFLREAVARTKLNLAVLIVEQAMRYDTHPEVSGPAAWSKQDVKRVFETLREWGVEPVPCMNSLGHMNWLCIPRRELAEDGDVHQICTTHPEAEPIVKALYQEVIDLVRPKYFHVGLDEIRWNTANLPPEQRCPRCAGVNKQDLFVDWVDRLHGFLGGQGIRMMLWGDMILPGHNGGPPYNLAATVDRLPKDVIVANWSTRVVPDSAKWLLDRGFAQVIKSNSAGATLAEQPILAGNMFGCWCKVPWLVEGTLPKREVNAYGAFLETAEYSWNHWTDLFDPMPPLEPGFFAARPLAQFRIGAKPVRGERIDPVPLPETSSLPGLPAGPVRFGHLRFELGGAIQPEAGGEAAIPIGRHVTALYLLHGARLVDREGMVEALKRREYWQGVPVARYEVRFASGTTESIPVRYAMEVRDPEPDWCLAPIAYGSLGASPATVGAEGMHLYGMQWRNPRPEDGIESIVFRQGDPAARVALAGMLIQGGGW